tara:strand:+ start:357 stop:590 length:234 start_codon:yes stop_codon:yes gene_type:complete
MCKKLHNPDILFLFRERNNDIFCRGENHLVYQDNKKIKLKDSEIRHNKYYKYIKPQSVNHNFWDGFHGWRYLFSCFY